MAGMPDPLLAGFVVGASQTASDLIPFIVVMAAGFLLGAWGQSARYPIAVIAGILLIMLAIGGFMIENGSGPDQAP
jgi:hypothetical protein